LRRYESVLYQAGYQGSGSFPRNRFTANDMHQTSDLTLANATLDTKYGYDNVLTARQ